MVFNFQWTRAVTKGEGERERNDQGAKLLEGRRKVPTMSQVVSFAPKHPKVGIWGAKLVFCPGRHVTWVGPAMGQINLFCKIFVRWFFMANFPENSSKS